MAKSTIVPRRGLQYQARVAWLKLLELRTNDYVESVTFEDNEVSFLDDVVVSYREPILDRLTGKRVIRDLFQCKYHMTLRDAFSCKNLTSPKFLNGKTSMLKRLYKAYKSLSKGLCPHSFRMYVVSNWSWDHRDAAAEHIYEGKIRSSFYEKGPRSAEGKARSMLAGHLLISDDELRCFLGHVRFDLGKDLTDLMDAMQSQLQNAGLLPIDPTITENRYDELLWELFGQGRHSFTKETFSQVIHEEQLMAPISEDFSEISIQSFAQFARRPSDSQAAHLDLQELFDRRLAKNTCYWKKEIPERVSNFLLDEGLGALPQPIHLLFDCHLSMAFLAGNLNSPKHRIEIIPTQKAGSDYVVWSGNARDTTDKLWEFTTIKSIGDAVVLGISVTHDVRKGLQSCLVTEALSDLPQILAYPIGGIGPKAISGGTHAWELATQMAEHLKEILPVTCKTIHLFYAGPVALGYILGHTLRYVTKSFQLYEYDFEGQSGERRYYPSLRVPYRL